MVGATSLNVDWGQTRQPLLVVLPVHLPAHVHQVLHLYVLWQLQLLQHCLQIIVFVRIFSLPICVLLLQPLNVDAGQTWQPLLVVLLVHLPAHVHQVLHLYVLRQLQLLQH